MRLTSGLGMIAKVAALALLATLLGALVAARTPYLCTASSNHVVHQVIAKAQAPAEGTRVLVLGDSVCAQLYPPGADVAGLVSLASNCGSSLIGQRLLLENWLEANPSVRSISVVLMVVPDTLGNDLANPFTYSNLIKPFWRREWRTRFDPLEQARIRQFRFAWLSQNPFVQLSDWCPTSFPHFGPRPGLDDLWLSDISALELAKMEALAVARGCTFSVWPGVWRESKRQLDAAPFAKQVASAGLQGCLGDYLARVRYIPDQQFQDRVHLIDPKPLGRDPMHFLAAGNR